MALHYEWHAFALRPGEGQVGVVEQSSNEGQQNVRPVLHDLRLPLLNPQSDVSLCEPGDLFPRPVLVRVQNLADGAEVKRVRHARLPLEILLDRAIDAVEGAPSMKGRVEQLADGVRV